MTTGLQIKQVADATGFSPATLRYYEQIGLLPEPARSAAGYRLYDQRALDRLAFIGRAKQLGCTLEEITGLTEAWDGGRCGPVQVQLRLLVAGKLATAHDQIGELVTFAAQLQQAAATLDGHRPEGACDTDCGCLAEPGSAPAAGATTVRAVRLTPKSAAPSAPTGATAAADLACTLGAGQVTGRIADWQALVAHVARREQIDGGVRCVFAPSAPTGELMRLVAAEQECCRFLRFTITVDARGTALEVRAPNEARPIVESMFGVPA